jgi:hypothetical protein
VSALRSPTGSRALEPGQVTAELPADDFVEFWRAGARAQGSFRCVECGFGLATVHRLPRCASCGARYWERAGTSPFELEPANSTLRENPVAVARVFRGAYYGIVLGLVLWLGIAGVAFGLLRLIHG